MLDMRIKNVSIVDGSGDPAVIGCVGIRDGKLVTGKKAEQDEAKKELDASGLTLCPGFIDSHSHSDRYIGRDPEVITLCKLSQGITTQVSGQCGSSLFPVPQDQEERMREYLEEDSGEEPPAELDEFRNFETYLAYVGRQTLPVNYAFLVGHSSLRMAAMGYENRPATPEEMEKMKAALCEAMEHGCFGMSSGLIYVPGVYAPTEELIELCRVMKPYGGIYATHMRSESDHVVDGVREAIHIAEAAGVPLFISHHKVCGVRNWGASEETLRLVHEAIERGVKITMDLYPYTASQTGLCQCMPPKYFTEGPAEASKLLRDPEMRRTIQREMTEVPCSYNSSYQNANGFDGILILACPKTPEAEGMTLREWAVKCGKDEFEAYFDLMEENECAGSGAFFCMSEDEVERIYMDPNTVIGTDGLVSRSTGPTHPRAYGSLVRPLCRFALEKGMLTFEQAVRKETDLTARRWGLNRKGRIADGYDADLVLLSKAELEDRADFLHPRQLCAGIRTVWVNGEIAYQDGKICDCTSGRALVHSPGVF